MVKPFPGMDGILFDLDGTLWDAVEPVCAAWNLALGETPGLRPAMTQAEIAGCMGMPMDAIAAKLFPMLDAAGQARMMDLCCHHEHEYLATHSGKVYPQVEETLAKLSARWPLFIVSNCEEGYIPCFFAATGLGKYFQDVECFGATGRSKGQNNLLVMERNGLCQPIYVGDTAGDQESARVAGIPFVYARYGLGNAQGYDHAIDAFAQLQALLEE